MSNTGRATQEGQYIQVMLSGYGPHGWSVNVELRRNNEYYPFVITGFVIYQDTHWIQFMY